LDAKRRERRGPKAGTDCAGAVKKRTGLEARSLN
jgi:hypothetical protein